MSNGEREIGKTIQKAEDLDTRLTRIEDKVDDILCTVNKWKGMIIVYSGLGALIVTIVLKIFWN